MAWGSCVPRGVHHQPLLLTRAASEVAVAGDEAESVQVAGVEQVHGIDDQCAVGCVLTDRVAELLDWLDRVPKQLRFPRGQAR